MSGQIGKTRTNFCLDLVQVNPVYIDLQFHLLFTSIPDISRQWVIMKGCVQWTLVYMQLESFLLFGTDRRSLCSKWGLLRELVILILLHSERPKLYGVLTVLSAIGLQVTTTVVYLKLRTP